MLAAITAIFAFQLVGEVLVVSFGFPVPGPVAGMVLLFFYLLTAGSVPAHLARVTERLLGQLALLFIPAGVGILQHGARLEAQGPGIMAAIILPTLLSIVVTGFVLSRLRSRRKSSS